MTLLYMTNLTVVAAVRWRAYTGSAGGGDS